MDDEESQDENSLDREQYCPSHEDTISINDIIQEEDFIDHQRLREEGHHNTHWFCDHGMLSQKTQMLFSHHYVV